ncbi:hypothetical protein [Bacillus taeanensis]|uniref:Deacetylase PdaC domain-containing protein n=1 Tax=Bacillus taeanensis TaxID=273032 RepID=A0A366XQN8_9BACI|nr:hypothetical protein [Bacillus taeanensis]RBW68432.1 hypothetical protein DS031_16585 [Bacillus taeanensis]
MRKNRMICAVLLSLGLLLTACGQTEETKNDQSPNVEEEVVSKNVENDAAEDEGKEAPEETPKEKTSSSEHENSEPDMEYELTKKIYKENNITISYPQISNLADEAKQTEINDLLFIEAYKVMNFYPETEGLELEIDYTISFQNPYFLSAQYSGMGFVEGTAHPSHMFYTTNIDVTNAKRIKLIDVVIPSEAFVELFKSDAFRAVNPDHEGMAKELKEYVTASDFENADSLDDIGTEKHSEAFSYFTENALGISIGVSHAAGGYAAFEINYNDLPSDLVVEKDILELLKIVE